MAEFRLVRLDSEGNRENLNTDTTRFAGHTITSGGAGIVFDDPAVDGIKPTAATITADNLMAKDRDNTMATAAAVLFATASNVAAQVDMLRLPAMITPPTAVPAAGGAGYAVWYDASPYGAMYIWNSATSSWDDQSISNEANNVTTIYSAAVTVATGQAVYIDSDNTVAPALATAATLSRVVGFAKHGAATGATLSVIGAGAPAVFTGLTVQAPYYLDPAVTGAVTTVLPTASNKHAVLVGYAKQTNAIAIQFQRLAVRT